MFIENIKYRIVRVTLAVLLMVGTFGVKSVQAETINFGWAKRIGGANFDYETALALDDSGNVYTTGFVIRNSGNQDGFIHKWDSTGTNLWIYGLAGLSDEKVHAIALDGEGNVYVAGVFSGTTDFDGSGSVGTLTSAGLTDIFILKLDGNLNFLWVKGLGGISSDGGYGITVDNSDNIYVTGTYTDTVDFDPSTGVSNITSVGYADVFILKLDSTGDFLWAKNIGGPAIENSLDIALDQNGNIFTTGSFSGTADFDPGIGTSNLMSSGEDDLFIDKLDTQGNFIWARSVGGPGVDSGTEVTLDGSGNVYTVGYFNDTVSAGINTLTSAGSNDILITKLSSDGNFLWAKGMGGTSFDSGYGIAVDENSNVYTIGEFSGMSDFDPGAETSYLTSAGLSDIFISKMDSNGNFILAKNLGGISTDIGEGIAVQNGSLFITGAFSDTVDFDSGEGTSMLTSIAGLDVFVSKLISSQIHYVKWNATGANNGSSWTNAYTDLQSALSAASSGDEIWVAAGTYKPTTGVDRTISFTLKNGIAIYGGFAGTETMLSQRNFQSNVAVLSGEIGAAGTTDNSYHVVLGGGTNNTAVLDGFTVTAGNANGAYPYDAGGGLYNSSGSPSLANLIFSANSALSGGGMFNNTSSPSLTNVIFNGNSAEDGGGMGNYMSSPSLTNVSFIANVANTSGGGMFNYTASPSLMNVLFSGNSAGSVGGGMVNMFNSSPSLTNVTFYNNLAVELGGAIGYTGNSSGGSPTLINVTLNANTAANGGGIYNGNINLTIKNSILWGNTNGDLVNFNSSIPVITYSIVQGGYAGTGNLNSDPLLGALSNNGGYTQTMALGAGSPAIDSGTNTGCPATDQRGVTRPQGGQCDIGAYEYQSSPHTVIFNANGSTGSMSNQIASSATSLTANTFTRTGYTFTGWNTAANGSGMAYANGASYPFTADVTLYAQWMINANTVTITGNVGVAGATLSYTDGTPKTVTADGAGNYTIVVPWGWSGTVTPSLNTDAFCPASQTYANVTTSRTGQNYAHDACRTFDAISKWTSAFDLSHGWTVASYVRTAGDVNNDGKDDLIGFGQDGVYVALSNGTSFDAISKWTSAFDLSHGWTVASYVRTVGDVNNDGRADLVGFGQDGVYVALSNGTSFDAVSKWTSAFDLSHGWTVKDYVRMVGDVNNDGRADLVGFGQDGVYVALSNGTSFGAISKWTSAFDLSHGWTVKDYVRTVGDVNNDGRADLIGFGQDGVYVALSNGTSFGAISKWTSAFDLSHGWTVKDYVRTVGDVNNDGRVDLIGFGQDGVYISLSMGTTFSLPSRRTTSFDLAHGWTVASYVRTVGDVSGDGKADLVGFGLDGVYIVK